MEIYVNDKMTRSAVSLIYEAVDNFNRYIVKFDTESIQNLDQVADAFLAGYFLSKNVSEEDAGNLCEKLIWGYQWPQDGTLSLPPNFA
jgi:hypothetical protein